jgi:hypothetical protein
MENFEERLKRIENLLVEYTFLFAALEKHHSEWFSSVKYMLEATLDGNHQARKEQLDVSEILYLFERLGFKKQLIDARIPDAQIARLIEAISGFDGENIRQRLNIYTLRNPNRDDITEPERAFKQRLRGRGLDKVVDLIESRG